MQHFLRHSKGNVNINSLRIGSMENTSTKLKAGKTPASKRKKRWVGLVMGWAEGLEREP